jgi:dienelactone hydrolase
MADPAAFDAYIQAQGKSLRADDKPPATLAAWKARRETLRKHLLAAMGPVPDKPCDLSARIVATLKRPGYRIENVLFQSRPDVWVTANTYVPDNVKGKGPAVLVVHGHWAGARRDPVVQARCLGLVKLGFFVLCVDAFGAGERHPSAARGGYHGALIGSTLWPAGLTLLGAQVYENRRAVDYLVSRPEVDGDRLGITGASGGGNQTMYAGALDERFAAVVPVCSVGTYQAYLKAACCVCEVLPGALTFTEEGDVLGLVAPRALLVINATQDALQFSVGEARKSLERARAIFKLYGREDRVRHDTFDSPHAYNQAMREAMYGWMTRALKHEGTGKPIAEPKHDVEKPEDLACYAEGKRPATFVFPGTLAAREARRLLSSFVTGKLDHAEAWEARAGLMQEKLDEALGKLPALLGKVSGKLGKTTTKGGLRTTTLAVELTEDLALPVTVRAQAGAGKAKAAPCILLHLEGKDKALEHPLARALLAGGRTIYAVDLRATGELKPARDAIAGAVDHNSAEHALWVGQPLLGQWVVDVRAVIEHIATQPGLDARKLAVVGLGQAGLVALCAAAAPRPAAARPASVAVVGMPASLVTATAYPAGTHMGLLAPGLFTAGDVPHLAALVAPRRLTVAGGVSAQGKPLEQKALEQAFAFTHKVYGLLKSSEALVVQAQIEPAQIAVRL